MGFKPDPQQPAASGGRFVPDAPAPAPTDAGGPRRYSAQNESSYADEYSQGVKRAGVEAAKAGQETSIPAVLRDLVGGAESALTMATGALAPVPGAIKTALTGQPYTEARDSYVYEPRSAPGKAAVGTIGAMAKPVTDVFNAASGGVEDFASMLGASPETAEQIAAPVMDIGTAAIPARIARAPKVERVVKSSAKPEGRAALENIRKQGLKVTPKEASELTGDRNYVGRALQAIGGDAKVTKDIAAANKPVLNEMARKAVGSESLTETGLKPVKDAGNAVYNEMASLGTVTPTTELSAAIEAARGSAGKSTKRNVEIDKFVDGVLNEFIDEVDAGQVVNRVRELRRDAANSRKGEGDKRPTVQQEALGEAQRKVADALDDFLEYNAATAGKSELAQRYKENRTRLAKVGTVEEASRAGNINAKQVYEQKKRGAPLSGKLDDIAQANEYAPGSTAPNSAESLMDAPGRNVDVLELPVMALQAIARHMGVNKFLQSDLYQNMIGGRAGGPHIAEHDTNPSAFPPSAPRAPAPAGPTQVAPDFAGELGLAPDVPYEALPGDVTQTVQNGRQLAEALGLQLDEQVQPAGMGPARGRLPGYGNEIDFEAPGDVPPYRINTDIPFTQTPNDLAGARVTDASIGDAGDLQLMPDDAPGPYQELPPKPRRLPRQGGALREPAPRSVPSAVQAETVPPEGLSELGALIDEMLSGRKQNPAQQQQAQVVPGTIEEALGIKEYFPDRYKTPNATRISESPEDGYIAYESKDGRRQINDAYVKETSRGTGLGQKNLVKAAKEAEAAGEALDSDVSITPAQARAYIRARDKGLIQFEIADQEAWDEALTNGTNIKAGGQPVVKNIRPAKKQ